jgi:branched-chain amino acid transport system permease protein
MTELLQYMISGIALGSVYALVALGFVVIYKASEIFNFAHGELLTLGALMMIWLSAPPLDHSQAFGLGTSDIDGLGWPWGVALVVSMTLVGSLAALIEKVALRPLVGRPVFVPIIITLFIGFLMRTIMILLWGTGSLSLNTPWDPMSALEFSGVVIDYNAGSVTLVTLIVLFTFFSILRYSRLGIAMRATASDQETSMALGIPIAKVFAMTWFIAGAFAALGGIFIAIREPSIDATTTSLIAFRAFPAVIVGGLESPLGAVIAGILMGVLEVLTQGYINDSFGELSKNFHIVFPYLVMILVLIIKPYGLFGQKKVQRL